MSKTTIGYVTIPIDTDIGIADIISYRRETAHQLPS